MYEEEPFEDLFQGDVLTGLTFGKVDDSSNATEDLTDSYTVEVHQNPIIILSHSCDVSKQNVGKRHRFLFTPLSELRSGRVEESPNLPDEPTDLNEPQNGAWHYVNLFNFEQHPSLPDDSSFGYLVDFTYIYTGNYDHETLLEAKELQLEEEIRRNLKKKIAAHFGRG
jgi:hypothetical protein